MRMRAATGGATQLALGAVCLLAALVLGIAAAVQAARRESRRIADCRELAGHAIEHLDTRLDIALYSASKARCGRPASKGAVRC